MRSLAQRPLHVGIIMDGNGRWANHRGWRRFQGHVSGADRVMSIIEEAIELQLEAFSLFCFSTENWNRPSEEVGFLMDLMSKFVEKQLSRIHALNVKIRVLGDLINAPNHLKNQLRLSVEQTKNNTGLALNFMVSYGGRLDILQAAKKLAKECVAGNLTPDQIDEKTFSLNLFTQDLPDPDFIIRTSGEFRFSNFMLWQSAYAEFFVSPKLWPDFTPQDLRSACAEFGQRKRRFGCAEDHIGEGGPTNEILSEIVNV